MKQLMINGLAAGTLFAATAISIPAATVNQRRENQQDRIAQGVKSGQLTAHETASLERREAGVNRRIHNDRMANNGHLTGGERRQINREQNMTSRSIYRDKHNAARQ